MAEDKAEFERRVKALDEAGEAGDWDKVIQLGEALRTEFPDSFDTNETNTENLASAYNNHGNSYADLEQYERAIENYDKAIGLKPDYAKAYSNRGSSYDELKQYKRAIADYDKAIELKPDYVSAYINRGISYANLEKYARAIEDYDRAMEIDPENVDAHHNRALAIGRQEAEKATQTIKESYEERLASITTPDEIDKFMKVKYPIAPNV